MVVMIGPVPLMRSTNGRFVRFPNCHDLGRLKFAEHFEPEQFFGSRTVLCIVWLVFQIGCESSTRCDLVLNLVCHLGPES